MDLALGHTGKICAENINIAKRSCHGWLKRMTSSSYEGALKMDLA